MPFAPYDPAAGGPSQGAAIDQMVGADNMQTVFDRGQKTQALGNLNIDQQQFATPALESSLGATGQYYSGAARHAESQLAMGFDRQRDAVSSAFARSQMELKRNEIFAGIGLML